ncbi:MAG: HEAT repeat domain-containing protein, partial [Bryobacteraceae bacterium]
AMRVGDAMKTMRWFALAAALPLALAVSAADQPKVTNAQMETRAVSGSLEGMVKSIESAQTAPVWVGYAEPILASEPGRHRVMCCGSWSSDWNSGNCGPCSLESDRGNNMTNSDGPGASGNPVKLEGPDTMFILLRIADHQIGQVRAFSPECQMDAGGLKFIWLTDAKPAESVALLAGIVTSANIEDRGGRQPGDGAVMAIALHADPAADRALASFVSPDRPEALRSKVSFWLGNERGRSGLDLLKQMAKHDPSTKVREQVTFALSQSHERDAMDELIRMAKEDESTKVRGQALFWLAQKAGQRAAGAITEAIENDPDTDVKKRAVFALSQLPKDQGVPMLIQVAKTNKNPVVRKQSMFWLGQSNDPRALAFFEDVLTH